MQVSIVDSLKTELKHRAQAYTEIRERFGFLVDRSLQDVSKEVISAKCKALALTYKDDLVADDLVSELSQFHHY